MGINGLLPFVGKSTKNTNVREFAKKTVAIDSYCWLHKGVYSCADKLIKGQPTDAYVRYCIKFIHMLHSHEIKPILVFDGRHLPAKTQTEEKRRESREMCRSKAIELMRTGQISEGRNLLVRSVDITHEIALNLIKECHKMGVDCIVAPYEADAQLAYLNISGIADVIITEDTDLILFGCDKILFKMDVCGNGVLYEKDKLHLAMNIRSENFDMEKFRYMCILSGCDYLASLPGVGLKKAKKFIDMSTDHDIHRALTRLGSSLNMRSLVVTQDYRDAFIRAIITFKHQLVFCPLQRKQVRLNPPTSEITEQQLKYAGEEIDPDLAIQLALGNCDPFSLKMLHNFDPDTAQDQHRRSNAWSNTKSSANHASIWSKNYKTNQTSKTLCKELTTSWPNTKGHEAVLQTGGFAVTKKKVQQINENEFNDTDSVEPTENILEVYKNDTDPIEETKNNTSLSLESDFYTEEGPSSPIFIRRTNPFAKQSSTDKVSPSLLLKRRSRLRTNNLRVRRTMINDNDVTESKFFAKANFTEESDVSTTDAETSMRATASPRDEKLYEENLNLKNLEVEHKLSPVSEPMDVDEKENNISLLKTNHLVEVKTVETISHSKCLLEYDSNKPHSENEVERMDVAEYDYLISTDSIDDAKNDLFNNSLKTASRRSSADKPTRFREKSLSSMQTAAQSRGVTAKVTRRGKQSLSGEQGQSLLSRYGFQKRCD